VGTDLGKREDSKNAGELQGVRGDKQRRLKERGLGKGQKNQPPEGDQPGKRQKKEG